MRRRAYGQYYPAKLNATIHPHNKQKLELYAKQNGVSASFVINMLIDMLDSPVGWDELEIKLIRENINKGKASR